MEKRSVVSIGGSVKKAIRGEYKLNVNAILKEAWQLTLHSRLPINLALMFSFILSLCVIYLASLPFGGLKMIFAGSEVADQNAQALIFINIIVTLVIAPFLAGVEMLGIYHAIGIKTTSITVFSFFKRGSWVAICALFTSTMITIGFELLYLPGLFLIVALSLTLPLVIEKEMSPINAIVVSIKATRFQWFSLFLIYMFFILVLFICALPLVFLGKSPLAIAGLMVFFISLTYLAPMFYYAKGILYREIFGVTEKMEPNDDNYSDSFIA